MRHLSTTLKVIFLALFIAAVSFEPEWRQFLSRFPISGLVRVTTIVLHFLIFALGLNLLILLLIGLYRRSKHMSAKQYDNVVLGLQNIYYLLVAGGVLLSIAGFFNIEPRDLFTSLSIVAAAIAIISKDFISEIISGMIIAFSKELSIGDYVKIGDKKGRIIDLTLTKIVLLNDDDDVIFLPNNKVYTSEIVNYTRKEIKNVSIEFEINLQALKTVEELEADLTETLDDYREHIAPESYNLKVVELRKDSLALKFQYVLNQINPELEREIRRKTVRRVVNFIKLRTATADDKKAPTVPIID
jgi:small-conductance mechanosensitive channel